MIGIIKNIWQSCLLRKYLVNLIDYRIEIYQRKSNAFAEKNQIDLYRNLRWQEIVGNSKENSIDKKLLNNLKIKLPFNAYLSKHIYFDDFENQELEFITRILHTNDIFIDIGANIGLFSLYASAKIKNGTIVAFEPTPSTFNHLRTNIELNKVENCQLYQIALSDKIGTLNFNVSMDGFDAFNGFAKLQYGTDSELIEVQTNFLDNYTKDLNNIDNSFTVIKIDVEGYELLVLEGAYKFLKEQSPVLLIEFTDENAERAGFNCQDVYNYLLKLGYSWFEFSENRLIESPIKDKYPYNNLIATKDIKLLQGRLMNKA